MRHGALISVIASAISRRLRCARGNLRAMPRVRCAMTSIPLGSESRDGSETLTETFEMRMPATRSPAEFVVTKCPLPGEPVTATFARLAAELAAEEAEILSLFIFGSIAAKPEIERAMRDTLGETQWPVT